MFVGQSLIMMARTGSVMDAITKRRIKNEAGWFYS